nr:phospholipase D family protein [Sinorhizobium fredii]
MIVCPFIKRRTAERLLSVRPPADFRIVTRFDLNAFNAGVSDLDALELLLQSGAKIRGIVGVHSKMYVFGSTRAIVTSANLTESAMFKNKEFGFTTDDPRYFLAMSQLLQEFVGLDEKRPYSVSH